MNPPPEAKAEWYDVTAYMPDIDGKVWDVLCFAYDAEGELYCIRHMRKRNGKVTHYDLPTVFAYLLPKYRDHLELRKDPADERPRLTVHSANQAGKVRARARTATPRLTVVR